MVCKSKEVYSIEGRGDGKNLKILPLKSAFNISKIFIRISKLKPTKFKKHEKVLMMVMMNYFREIDDRRMALSLISSWGSSQIRTIVNFRSATNIVWTCAESSVQAL